jgi:hypothetical protein
MFRRNKLAHLSLASIFRQVNPFYNGCHPEGIFRLGAKALAYFVGSINPFHDVPHPNGKLPALLRIIRQGINALAYFVESVYDEQFLLLHHSYSGTIS